MPTKLVRSPLIRVLVLASILYWAVAPWLPRRLLFDLANPITVFIWIGVLFAYGAFLWGLLRTDPDKLREGAFLWMTMGIAGVAIILMHSWNWVWREFGYPLWMQTHLFRAYIIILFGIAGVYALSAENVIAGKIPPRDWRRLGIIVAIALTVGFVVFATFGGFISLGDT